MKLPFNTICGSSTNHFDYKIIKTRINTAVGNEQNGKQFVRPQRR